MKNCDVLLVTFLSLFAFTAQQNFSVCSDIVTFSLSASQNQVNNAESRVQRDLNDLPPWLMRSCRSAIRNNLCFESFLPYALPSVEYCYDDCYFAETVVCDKIWSRLALISPNATNACLSMNLSSNSSTCMHSGVRPLNLEDDPVCPKPFQPQPLLQVTHNSYNISWSDKAVDFNTFQSNIYYDKLVGTGCTTPCPLVILSRSDWLSLKIGTLILIIFGFFASVAVVAAHSTTSTFSTMQVDNKSSMVDSVSLEEAKSMQKKRKTIVIRQRSSVATGNDVPCCPESKLFYFLSSLGSSIRRNLVVAFAFPSIFSCIFMFIYVIADWNFNLSCENDGVFHIRSGFCSFQGLLTHFSSLWFTCWSVCISFHLYSSIVLGYKKAKLDKLISNVFWVIVPTLISSIIIIVLLFDGYGATPTFMMPFCFLLRIPGVDLANNVFHPNEPTGGSKFGRSDWLYFAFFVIPNLVAVALCLFFMTAVILSVTKTVNKTAIYTNTHKPITRVIEVKTTAANLSEASPTNDIEEEEQEDDIGEEASPFSSLVERYRSSWFGGVLWFITCCSAGSMSKGLHNDDTGKLRSGSVVNKTASDWKNRTETFQKIVNYNRRTIRFVLIFCVLNGMTQIFTLFNLVRIRDEIINLLRHYGRCVLAISAVFPEESRSDPGFANGYTNDPLFICDDNDQDAIVGLGRKYVWQLYFISIWFCGIGIIPYLIYEGKGVLKYIVLYYWQAVSCKDSCASCSLFIFHKSTSVHSNQSDGHKKTFAAQETAIASLSHHEDDDVPNLELKTTNFQSRPLTPPPVATRGESEVSLRLGDNSPRFV